MTRTMDAFEAKALSTKEIKISELMSTMNKEFTTKLSPENGAFGVTEVVKDNGIVVRTWKNDAGHSVRQYYSDGHLYESREILGNGSNATVLYDDNGVPYLRTVKRTQDHVAKTVSNDLTPNVTVVKGNFTAKIDFLGRPIENKITDLQLRGKDVEKKDIPSVRNASYRPEDDQGHIIADSLGGPPTKENIVPQLGAVNKGNFKRVENIVRDLKAEGHTVDYEVKVNYVGSNDRPSSFEPKITVDGKEYTELPNDLRKIYNEADVSDFHKFTTTVGEKFGLAHEVGLKSGALAAGITCAVSTVDNVSAYIDGHITAEEMVVDIIEDTALAGAIGYGSAFVSTAVAQAMSHSSSALISQVGNSCAPAAVVAFGVQSFEDISAYAQGEIDTSELAYNLGENAAAVAGSMAGAHIGSVIGGAVGGAVGSVVPVAGTAAGMAVGSTVGGIVGGVVGCAIASEVYQTAVETVNEYSEVVLDTVKETANNVIESVKVNVPNAVDNVVGAFNNFFDTNNIPIHL